MTQEQEGKHPRPPVDRVTPDTFDRLDALSRPLAERVLNRAIALHHDEVHGPDRITRKQLDQIAKELGIEPEFVQAALVAELETGNDADAHSIKALLLAPDRITGGRIVEADRSTVERSIIEWLRGEEGFRPRTKTGSGYKWERDDHWATKLRMSVGGSKPSLRGLKTVTHRRTDLGDGRHLVELDADAKVVSMTGAGIIAGFGAASVLGGVAAAAGIAGGNDLAQFLAAMVPTAATGLAAGLITTKTWAASIRRGIDRALDGISSPELHHSRRRKTKRNRKTGIARVLDDIGDAIEDLFD